MNIAPASFASSTRRQRRTAEQWQAIINEFNQSGLHAKQFCAKSDLGYLSFCKWRKRLSVASAPSSPLAPAFIDLNALTSATAEPSATAWHIVLKLGNGVELCLDQAHVPA